MPGLVPGLLPVLVPVLVPVVVPAARCAQAMQLRLDWHALETLHAQAIQEDQEGTDWSLWNGQCLPVCHANVYNDLASVWMMLA